MTVPNLRVGVVDLAGDPVAGSHVALFVVNARGQPESTAGTLAGQCHHAATVETDDQGMADLPYWEEWGLPEVGDQTDNEVTGNLVQQMAPLWDHDGRAREAAQLLFVATTGPPGDPGVGWVGTTTVRWDEFLSADRGDPVEITVDRRSLATFRLSHRGRPYAVVNVWKDAATSQNRPTEVLNAEVRAATRHPVLALPDQPMVDVQVPSVRETGNLLSRQNSTWDYKQDAIAFATLLFEHPIGASIRNTEYHRTRGMPRGRGLPGVIGRHPAAFERYAEGPQIEYAADVAASVALAREVPAAPLYAAARGVTFEAGTYDPAGPDVDDPNPVAETFEDPHFWIGLAGEKFDTLSDLDAALTVLDGIDAFTGVFDDAGDDPTTERPYDHELTAGDPGRFRPNLEDRLRTMGGPAHAVVQRVHLEPDGEDTVRFRGEFGTAVEVGGDLVTSIADDSYPAIDAFQCEFDLQPDVLSPNDR